MFRQILFGISIAFIVLKANVGFGFEKITTFSTNYATLFKSPNLSIQLNLNQATFTTNDKLIATATIKNGTEQVSAEVKSWIELPNDRLISIINLPSHTFLPDASITTKIFEHTFLGSEPEGKYYFGARFLNPISGQHISTSICQFVVDFPKAREVISDTIADYQTINAKINTNVDIILNKNILTQADELIANVHITNGTESVNVEVKIFIELPDKRLISLVNLLEYTIDADTDFEKEIISHIFNGSEPEGKYKFGARFLNPISGDYISTDIEEFSFDITPPNVIISQPAHNSYNSGTITIIGTATDINLAEYIISYGTNNLWHTIATSTINIENGTLATWNTTNIEDGTYTLRLVAKDKLDQSSTYTVTINLDNTLPFAQITFPTPNLKYKGTLNITGSCFDKNLVEYCVGYGKGITPATFTTIATSTISIINGTLATLNTNEIAEGTYTIHLQAKDKAKNISQNKVIFINAEPTAQEILQKVADNFGKIEDMKGTMTSWGSVGTKTFDKIEEIFMLKKPDKLKLISPTKNQTIIVNNDKIWIVTSKFGTQTIEMSEYSDITPSQLNFYYQLDKFIQAHELKVKSYKRNSIYIIEAIPKEVNESYNKLIIWINYKDGICTKIEAYLIEDDTPDMIRTIEEYRLIEDIFVPIKFTEEIFIGNEVIRSYGEFIDIQLNIGISDSEFEP